MPRLPLLFAALLLVAGCYDLPEPAPFTEADMTEEPLYFESIGEGQRALLTDTIRTLIRDADVWAAYRDSLRPQRGFTDVDFGQAMVALIAVPVRSGGHDVSVHSVLAVDSTIHIAYTFLRPDTDCVAAYAPSTVFEAVLIRRAAGTAVFEQDADTLPCTRSIW